MEQDWFFYSVTLFTFAVIFTFCYIRHVYTFFERKRIPRAGHPTFPFGNLYDVFFEKVPIFMQLWKFYNRFKRKKCKLGGFYLFLKPAIVLVDTTLVQLFFTDVFAKDERDDLDANFCGQVLASVVKSVEKVWPKLGPFAENEANFTQILGQELVGLCAREFFDSNDAKLCEVEGSRVFPLFRKCVSLSYPQFCKNENHRFRGKNFEKAAKNGVLQVLQKNGFSAKDRVDFIAELVDYLGKSSNLILFTLYELSLNREIQDDLRGEILRFRRNKDTFTYTELEQLTYLETVICETLRKYPMKPFVHKVCQKTFEQNGIKFDTNQTVFLSIFGIHHDVDNYINPELFDPDRFSEENEMFIDPIKYLPFGHQIKNDFDSLYAKLIMKMILIELLSKYEFALGKKSPKCITFDENLFEIKSREDMWLKIKKL
ncbi:cytochrome P450-like protein isoform X1 [Tribolium castaneum]|uniref:Cytochrome P450-like protein n=1 Tax=Tribolium castaneum TaxID=7070 RepID=D6WTV4_TRICA|nr:cytochrome P450-like protein [Tribolium castaneum]EFA07573.1 cytochrome P450-like protein [Tribolium castaneum]|eukprot:NP_001164359.1 cytochrome P450-like protein [Tribolium castaneum]